MPRAKIVCTLGPASATPERIGELIDAGMNVARLNFSHGSHEDHAKMLQVVRSEADRRNKAVADIRFLHLSGLPAWLVWLFVHIIFLVGFRNRLAVLIQWAWSYLTFNKGARLITRNFQAETRPLS